MTDYLIKSTIAMAVLLAVYYLFLEREKMHRFKRFYLISALAFSLVLPFIVIPFYVSTAAPSALPPEYIPVASSTPNITVAAPVNYLPYVLWSAYGVVSAVLIIRFVKNLSGFFNTIRKSSTAKYKNAILVLVDKTILPYTFLHYIFISKKDYDKKTVEAELFTHEMVHVSQYHSLDVLFAELLKTLMWFNPLLYFYKKAIQLNHEFLADDKTIQSHRLNIPSYQKMLLGKALPINQFALASSINFSLTKKRFIMMTKTTPKKKALMLKTLAVFIALCVTCSVSAKLIEVSPENATEKPDPDKYYSNVRFIINDMANNTYINKPYEELDDAEKEKYVPAPPIPLAKKEIMPTDYKSFKNKEKYAVYINEKPTDNILLNNFEVSSFVYYTVGRLTENARTKKQPQPYEVHLFTEQYYNEYLSKSHYPGEIFRLNITKEYKDDVLIAGQENPIYPLQELDVKPEYPGGVQEFMRYVNKNYQVPEVDKDMTARIFASFVIEKDGSMSNINILRDPGHGFGDEALRVLKTVTTKWKPGEMKGKPVRTEYTIPITINIRSEATESQKE